MKSKPRAINAWNHASRLLSEARVLNALRAGPMSRVDLQKALGMKPSTVWRTIDNLVQDGRVLKMPVGRRAANHSVEVMYELCDASIGPIPLETKPEPVVLVRRDPFVSALFGAREAMPLTRVPARVHRMVDDDQEAA